MTHHIAELFKRVGKDEEVIKWIQKFSSSNRTFAVLKIGGASIQKYSETICENLAILSRLDLITPLVYGYGDAFTEKLEKNGMGTTKCAKTELRITKKEDLPYLEEIVEEQGELIVNTLKEKGVLAQIIGGVFSAKRKDLEGINFDHHSGEVTGIHTQKVKECINNGIIPIIPPIGYSNEEELMNINADTAAKGLVLTLLPSKFILATNSGGVFDNKGQIIPKISIKEDYQRLIDEKILKGGMFVKTGAVIDTMRETPKDHNLDIIIVHPENILHELFTDSGVGTYITR